ncbi:hypothetical protein [Pimelobacter simplex]|uniref:hypothetical protein n=1 Tax=Nocardioides simplex TaxID=2045 RepID=UPI0021500334|nr:hypothetical protein [Pimelobacter simplex]UUW92471.1 hypothetical protein M0M43_13585 [Pimelobacter simplex]UUW96299.1 hypothetical protein M0M48_02220 [Pimelobacter simplex]
MTVETYGEHAENAAWALNRLLCDDSIPAETAAVDQLLPCRQAVVDALRQRLYGVGLNTAYPARNLPAPAPGLNLEGIDNKLATLLHNIASSMPTLPNDERLSPLEVLGTASTDPVVETWREAATELLAATHALDSADDKSWVRDHGAGWYVLRDAAVAIEAVLVLDDRLAEVGLFNGHQQPAYPMGLEEKRLITSQAARVATWYATSDAPDLATPRTPRAAANVMHPVSLVSVPEDLAAAQQRLAAFLRPLNANNAFYIGEPEISADSARQVIASQLHLCRVFANMAARSAKTVVFVPFFNERTEVLEALQPQVTHLIDVTAREPNMRRFWQQGELTAAINRMQERGVELTLQPHQMLTLANATHEVTYNLGRSLRRELLRSNTNILNGSPRHAGGPVRVGRSSRLEATLTDLVNMPAPKSPTTQFSNPLQRAALRQTLDMTPTAPRPPSPFPATRALDAKSYGR